MDPMKIITYVAITAVLALVALGGVAFYAGYTAGLGGPDKPAAAADTSDATNGTLGEIKSLKREVAALKSALAERRDKSEDKSDALAQTRARVAKLSDELEAVKKELATAKKEAQGLRKRLAAASESSESDVGASDSPGERRTASAAAAASDDAVVLYDRFQLEREGARGFDQVDLRFGLRTVGSKSAGLSVNGKRISMRVKDGKQIIHRGVTCELILLDTDQKVQRAQFSLACKR